MALSLLEVINPPETAFFTNSEALAGFTFDNLIAARSKSELPNLLHFTISPAYKTSLVTLGFVASKAIEAFSSSFNKSV